jgi:hypothetical protein
MNRWRSLYCPDNSAIAWVNRNNARQRRNRRIRIIVRGWMPRI